MRFSANGNCASKTCTWQSQAPAGTSKFGAVRLAGMSALATPACRAATDTPAAPKLCSMSRLVSMASPPFFGGGQSTPLLLGGTGRAAGRAGAGEVLRGNRAAARRAAQVLRDDGGEPEHDDGDVDLAHHHCPLI